MIDNSSHKKKNKQKQIDVCDVFVLTKKNIHPKMKSKEKERSINTD
jgi:hypothetical protein